MGDNCRTDELLDKLVERLESLEHTTRQPSITQWIPIYVALAGLFFSAANIYTGISTRIALLEQQVAIVKELVLKESIQP